MSDETKIRVRICNPEHPHYGKTGYLTGKQISLFGNPMAEISFDTEDGGAFISKGDIEIV